jgi:protein-L-isoaspartate(D-aspartate) O-methyltransferase
VLIRADFGLVKRLFISNRIVFKGRRYYKSSRRFYPELGGRGADSVEIVGRWAVMDFAAARYNMVENQIRANRISDPRVIQALAETPREAFLPKPLHGLAYMDEDVPLGGGRFLIEPLVLARLLQAADISSSDVVLAVGDASGWASAVISKLASTVVALESESDMASRAAPVLSQMGCDNVAVVRGPLDGGFPAQGPYDAIVFVGAVADIPVAFGRQLADKGRMVAVIRSGAGGGHVVRVVRAGDTFGRWRLFDAATPYLPGFSPKTGFCF